MKDEEQDIALIESYLLGRLNESELSAIQERLETDSTFKSLHDEMHYLITGVQNASSNEKLEIIRSFESKGAHKKNRQMGIYFKLAASFALIISIFFVVRYFHNPAKDLFTQFHETFPNQILPLTRDQNIPTGIKENAYYAYDIGDYEKAIELLNQLPMEEDDGAPIFYVGLSQLELKKADQAIESFKRYLSQYDIFREEAKLYLALAYILEESYNLAEQQLVLIDTVEHKELIELVRLQNQR